MQNISQRTLVHKIDRFIERKSREFPELALVEKSGSHINNQSEIRKKHS